MGSKRLTPGEAMTRWARLPVPPAPTASSERKDRFMAAIASSMGHGIAIRERARIRTRVLGVSGAAAAGVVLLLGPALAYMSWRDRARVVAVEVQGRSEPAHRNAAPSRLGPKEIAPGAAPSAAPSILAPILEETPRTGSTPPRGIQPRPSGRIRSSTGSTPSHSTAPPETRRAPDPVLDDPSDLAEQNRLFAGAMRARENGDDHGSARLLDEFIRTYPASPLLQEAYVSRFRALQSAGDRAEAALAARRYLFAWPNGYATQEAREVAREAASKGFVSSP